MGRMDVKTDARNVHVIVIFFFFFLLPSVLFLSDLDLHLFCLNVVARGPGLLVIPIPFPRHPCDLYIKSFPCIYIYHTAYCRLRYLHVLNLVDIMKFSRK